LTLIATPVVYSLLDDLGHTARWRKLAGSLAGVRGRVAGLGGRLAESRRQSHEAPVEMTAETRGAHEDKREQAGAGAGGD
jgi:hypothetical protein